MIDTLCISAFGSSVQTGCGGAFSEKMGLFLSGPHKQNDSIWVLILNWPPFGGISRLERGREFNASKVQNSKGIALGDYTWRLMGLSNRL